MKKITNTQPNQTEYNRLIEENQALQEINQKQQAQIGELEAKINFLIEQMKLAKHKRFGSSSEKNQCSGQMILECCFNEAEKEAEQPFVEPTVEEIKGYKRRKQKGHKEAKLANLPVEIIEHYLPEEEMFCEQCGGQRHVMGKETYKQIDIIPAQVKVIEHVTYTYACRICEREADTVTIVKAKAPEPVIKGSIASPSAVAYIMVQKYVNAMPLYRQEKDFANIGIDLSRQTMANWVIRCAMDWLEPVYNALHQTLKGREVLHADETVLQVLKEPNKKPQSNSYMWLFRTSGCDVDAPIILYEYQPDRKGIRPKEFLKDFVGYLHTDGYAGYHNLPETIIVVGCFAHARRYFDDALKTIPVKNRIGSLALIGKNYCDQLFSLERELSEYSDEERYNKRLEMAVPILDAFLEWLKTCNALPQSLIGKAVKYTLGQWQYLKNYLLDGRLELSNNRAERSIKPFVIGRKNFLFSDTPNGAKASAIIYSLVETAKENGLNPMAYLIYIMKELPNIEPKDLLVTIEKFLPWNVPDSCKTNPK